MHRLFNTFLTCLDLLFDDIFTCAELTERSVDRRLFEAGFLFPYNRDKDGNTLSKCLTPSNQWRTNKLFLLTISLCYEAKR